MSNGDELRRVREAYDKARRAYRDIEDGRVLKQELVVKDGMERLGRALRDLERAIGERV